MSRYFAKGREPMSSYTHFWGAVGGVIATFLLVGRSLWTETYHNTSPAPPYTPHLPNTSNPWPA